MAQVKDIALDDNFDLKIKNGDFVVSESDEQHIALIIRTYKGNWKEHALVGVGIDFEIASSGYDQIIKRNISVQLNNDGYKVEKVPMQKQGNDLLIAPAATRIK
jgi:hypothetical protein